MRNLRDSCPCLIHSLPQGRQEKWCELCGICVVILDPKQITRNSCDSLFLRFTALSRESSFFGADCMKSASLADVVGEWREICSVREHMLFLRFTAWSRESSSSGADCTKSASLADVFGEWHEICSVREQYPLFVYKRLTKTTVSLK